MIKSIEIGRDPQSDICVDGRFDTVSNKHATIDYDGESLIFIDHSSNGTVINGQRVKNMQVNIYQGDKILLAGSYLLDWNNINRFIPRMGRPTVTRNIHAGLPAQGRPTTDNRQKVQPSSRETNVISNPAGQSSQTTAYNKYSSVHSSIQEFNSQQEFDDALDNWNWGAFLLSWIWAAGHRYWMPLLWVIGLNFIVNVIAAMFQSVEVGLVLSFMASMGISIYLGIKGSRIAYDKDCYKDLRDFRRKEHNWTVGSIIYWIVLVLLFILAIIVS